MPEWDMMEPEDQEQDAPQQDGPGFPTFGVQGGPGRGNELEDAATLIMAAQQGASVQYLRQDAAMRNFRRSDLTKLLSMYSTTLQLQRLVGRDLQSFVAAAHFVASALKGRGRKRRAPGIKTVVKSLAYAADLASLLSHAGRRLASIATRHHAPSGGGGGHTVTFRRKVHSN